MEVERTPVEVLFTCRHCQLEWRQGYEVVRWTGYEGDLLETYFRRGVPVPPPMLGQRCPQCGSLNVSWADVSGLPRRATRPVQPVVSSHWSTPEPKPATLRFFTRAAHQREPLTRRFP
ncbi:MULTISPECIES: hypothetical protein [unclassified Pseudofrankia]|uniref:hypothetical protein n=1 Tax=unclassified Pseudofrankia TaxID=2994372 RepID=UPI0008D93D6E|nr:MULTISPECIES: hypothetical protein [unclassified Pseudofrankia]MDT3443462.1 hypothetical protein [Pseudofrankia sp. BMG5.37]OHV45307.1 hypothetical protein BCD48_22920 [Pseudofrankia sp. BMG5.36]